MIASKRMPGPVTRGTFVDLGPWEHIETVTLAAAASSVSIQGIDPAYKVFRLSCFLEAASAATVHLRLNNDSGNNYAYQFVEADTTAVTPARSVTQAQFVLSQDGLSDTEPSVLEAVIAKPLAAQAGLLFVTSNTTDAGTINAYVVSGQWSNTADLINRIDVLTSTNNFGTNSRVVLEGIRIA